MQTGNSYDFFERDDIYRHRSLSIYQNHDEVEVLNTWWRSDQEQSADGRNETEKVKRDSTGSSSIASTVTYVEKENNASEVRANTQGIKSKPRRFLRTLAGPVETIVACTALAFALILAHHFVFSSLHNSPISSHSQTLISTLSTGAVFVVKSALSIAIAVSFQEVLWHTLRTRFLRIDNIDSLFSLPSNPLHFLHHSLIVQAPLALLVSLIGWTVGVVLFFTPSSLRVEIRTSEPIQRPCQVRIWTPSESFTEFDESDYLGPTTDFWRLSRQTATAGAPLSVPLPQGCQANCTTASAFWAPGFQCMGKEASEWDAMLAAKLDDQSIYRCPNQYCGKQDGLDDATVIWTVNEEQNFVIDGYSDLWMQYSTPGTTCQDVSCLITIMCKPVNASYNVTFDYVSSIPSYSFTIVETKEIDMSEFNEATLDVVNELFKGEVTIAQDYEEGWGHELRIPAFIASMGLVRIGRDRVDVLRPMEEVVPEVMANVTISTLTFPSTQTQDGVCTSTITQTVFVYQPVILLSSYLAALSAALLCCFFGLRALSLSIAPTGPIFSQLIVTTRNPAFDALSKGTTVGSTTAEALRREKVRFGEFLREGKGEGKVAAFGREDEVVPLRKGELYDG
ncbi:hypothetical protein BT69DRAFT_1352008 [Atractiella rhizophila]|nr:hypothetical protein BT69DRAFT_1352008 [Atractiella rhizophila]